VEWRSAFGHYVLGQYPTLYIVDGMPVENGTLTSRISEGREQCVGLMNPNDIEKLYVLADAAPRRCMDPASNGVVIITTKRGRIQAPRSFDVQRESLIRSEHKAAQFHSSSNYKERRLRCGRIRCPGLYLELPMRLYGLAKRGAAASDRSHINCRDRKEMQTRSTHEWKYREEEGVH